MAPNVATDRTATPAGARRQEKCSWRAPETRTKAELTQKPGVVYSGFRSARTAGDFVDQTSVRERPHEELHGEAGRGGRAVGGRRCRRENRGATGGGHRADLDGQASTPVYAACGMRRLGDCDQRPESAVDGKEMGAEDVREVLRLSGRAPDRTGVAPASAEAGGNPAIGGTADASEEQ